MKGKLTTVSGPMGAGKSAKLIDMYKGIYYEDRILAFKHSFDTRFDLNEEAVIADRKGNKIPVIKIHDIFEISKHLKSNTAHIFVDETNFFESEVNPDLGIDLVELERRKFASFKLILELVNRGININLFGLDFTAEMYPYGLMSYMIPHADEHLRLKAECAKCGLDAYYTFFLPEEKKDVNILGSDSYCALCFSHHVEATNLRREGKPHGLVHKPRNITR